MLLFRQFFKALLFVGILAALLFGTSGKPDWSAGWVYLGIYALCAAASTIIMVVHNPDLLTERMYPKKVAKNWDRVLAPVMAGLCPALIVLVAGLDKRFDWSPPVPLAAQCAAGIAAVAGHALLTWSMMTNTFFSAIVRIQKDRGHRVVTAGPYCFIRHPGYAGMIIFALATPLMLGTLWAFIPASVNLGVGMLRIVLEDGALRAELDGYCDYAGQVPYRLLPGVW